MCHTNSGCKWNTCNSHRLNQAVNTDVTREDGTAHQTIESVLKKVIRRPYPEESPLRVKFSGKSSTIKRIALVCFKTTSTTDRINYRTLTLPIIIGNYAIRPYSVVNHPKPFFRMLPNPSRVLCCELLPVLYRNDPSRASFNMLSTWEKSHPQHFSFELKQVKFKLKRKARENAFKLFWIEFRRTSDECPTLEVFEISQLLKFMGTQV